MLWRPRLASARSATRLGPAEGGIGGTRLRPRTVAPVRSLIIASGGGTIATRIVAGVVSDVWPIGVALARTVGVTLVADVCITVDVNGVPTAPVDGVAAAPIAAVPRSFVV